MPENLHELWKEQPLDSGSVLLPEPRYMRTRDLAPRTRSEILSSTGAVFLFVFLLVWRFDSIRDPFVLLSFVPMAVWILTVALRYRNRIWPGAAIAAPGIEFYRSELEKRRAHLRNLWLWHGPLLFACLTLTAVWLRKSVVSVQRLVSVSPLLLVLLIWTAMGVRKRQREAEAIQMEIDEMKDMQEPGL